MSALLVSNLLMFLRKKAMIEVERAKKDTAHAKAMVIGPKIKLN